VLDSAAKTHPRRTAEQLSTGSFLISGIFDLLLQVRHSSDYDWSRLLLYLSKPDDFKRGQPDDIIHRDN
jgi:hypothetical protein